MLPVGSRRRPRTIGLQGTLSLLRLGVRAIEPGELQDVLDEVAQSTREILGADSVVLYQYVGREAEVWVRAAAGMSEHPVHGMLEDRAASVMRLEADETLAVGDWSSQAPGECALLLSEAGVAATVAVAVAERDRVFGALGVNFNQPREFQPDEIDTVRAIANLVAGSTERERTADEMRHRALHDPLTGLPNRMLFVDRLQQSIAHCGRRSRSIGVLFLDVDHFKYINDSLGHSVGDELLCAVAERLAAVVRSGDTVARFGGDEFVIICDDVWDRLQVTEIAERVVETMRTPFTLEGVKHVLSTSVGIAIADDEKRDAEDLIREADAAMYRAKEDGRDRYEVYDEVMRAKATKRLNIERELRAALENDELRLAYQPVVNLSSGRIEGVEALVRWQHPRRGLLYPGEFIPVAEQTGVIRAVGGWVLSTAARQAAAWQRQRPESPMPVAVNLSARQVTHHTLLPVVEEVLQSNELDPHLLHLEITESVLMDPSDTNIERLMELKELGITIVLDDFGTGYSSLAYVERFPIDTLKIDQAFMREVSVGATRASIVEAIIAMGHGLRVEVIAEGVERREQAELLMRLGCAHAQGHLFSAAVAASEIDAMLDGAVVDSPRPALQRRARPAA